ncbi:MAG: hypothetical protein ACLGG0_14495 [Bacteriovoracia bacterium]
MLSLNTTKVESNDLPQFNFPKTKRALIRLIKIVTFLFIGLVTVVSLFEFSPEILKSFYGQLFVLFFTVGMTAFSLRIQTHQKMLFSFVLLLPTSILIASYILAIADFNPKVELTEKITNLIELGPLAKDELHSHMISDLEISAENTYTLQSYSLKKYIDHFPDRKNQIINTKKKLASLCELNFDYRCRLLAYVEKIELDAEELSYQTMEKGCPKDLKSCLFFYGDDKSTEHQRSLSISELSKRCTGQEDWKDFSTCNSYRSRRAKEEKKEKKALKPKTSAHHPNISGQT